MSEISTLSAFQMILLFLILMGILHYIWLIYKDKYEIIKSDFSEGFTGASSDAEVSRTTWFENEELFDEFYGSVYDNLTQLSGRYPQELALILHQWKKTASTDEMDVLDVGCGTGIASVLLAKMGVHSIVGLDKSEAMLRRARNVVLPAMALSQEKKDSVTFLQGDMNQQATFTAGQFSNAVVLFFVIYYSIDKAGLFQNLFHWIRPGGSIAIEVVNKYKFDPMLEAASPFVGVSLQKYTKERITKSKVEFDRFSYEAEFDLQDPAAEFRETFRFADKSVRRQRHTLNMTDIKDIVHLAQTAGWKYEGNIDLVTAGFEYAYVLLFTHP
uniref:Methyltransferase domain-containing protein n=1 Tax=viral metagenome TaxID=1070528 RepID=A0A6C0LPS6_9ZZZZ